MAKIGEDSSEENGKEEISKRVGSMPASNSGPEPAQVKPKQPKVGPEPASNIKKDKVEEHVARRCVHTGSAEGVVLAKMFLVAS